MNTTDDETSELSSMKTNMAPPTTTLAKSKKGVVVLMALCMLFFYTGRLSSSTTSGSGGGASLDASFLRGFQHDVVGVFPCDPEPACPETCNAIVGFSCVGLLTAVSKQCGCDATIECAVKFVNSSFRVDTPITPGLINGIACVLENWNAK